MGWFHNTELNEIQALIERGEVSIIKEAQTKLKARLDKRFNKKELEKVINNIGINLESFSDFQKGAEFELTRNNQDQALKSIKNAKISLKKLKTNIKHLVEIEKILED
jgi:hypothetical protein